MFDTAPLTRARVAVCWTGFGFGVAVHVKPDMSFDLTGYAKKFTSCNYWTCYVKRPPLGSMQNVESSTGCSKVAGRSATGDRETKARGILTLYAWSSIGVQLSRTVRTVLITTMRTPRGFLTGRFRNATRTTGHALPRESLVEIVHVWRRAIENSRQHDRTIIG